MIKRTTRIVKHDGTEMIKVEYLVTPTQADIARVDATCLRAKKEREQKRSMVYVGMDDAPHNQGPRGRGRPPLSSYNDDDMEDMDESYGQTTSVTKVQLSLIIFPDIP